MVMEFQHILLVILLGIILGIISIIVGIIYNKQHKIPRPQLHPNLTLPTIISQMLTQRKLQTNTVEMEEEARVLIFRQAIGQQRQEEKVEKVVKLNCPINLILMDKFK